MKIAVFGHTGFIGSNVYRRLSEIYEVSGFNSISSPSGEFDAIVNCAGVSSKYSTEMDFSPSYSKECRVLANLKKISSSRIIHISSVDVTSPTRYGHLKSWVEDRMRDLCPVSIILRVVGVVGPGIKKNVVFDLQRGRQIYLTEDSILNFVSTVTISDLICSLIEEWISGEIYHGPQCFNVAASSPILVSDLSKLIGGSSPSWGDDFQDYSGIDISELARYIEPKTSLAYIEEYLGRY